MMKKILLFALLFPFILSAQGVMPSGGRGMSMGNALTSIEDEWSFFYNPAATSRFKNFKAGIYYENRFLLKELQSQALTASLPIGKGVLTFGGHHYGYSQFRSYKAGVGYSMMLAEKFSMGVQLNYQGLSLNQNYGSVNTMTADVGLLTDITTKWSVGFSVYNLGRTKLADYEDDRLTTEMRLGTNYKFSDKLMISVDADKDLDYKLRMRTGIEYEAVDGLFLRGGLVTNRLELSFGMGYEISLFRIDLGTSFDQVLGWSPHFALVFMNKSKTE